VGDHFLITSEEWPPTPASFMSKAQSIIKSKGCWEPHQQTEYEREYAIMMFEKQLSDSQLQEYRENMRKVRNKSSECG
jgi:hypothetical protein